jgi:hypothetical protein
MAANLTFYDGKQLLTLPDSCNAPFAAIVIVLNRKGIIKLALDEKDLLATNISK